MAKPIWAYGNNGKGNGKGNGKKIEKLAYQMRYKHEKQELKTEYILKCVELKHVSDNVMTCSNLKIHRVINKDVLKNDGTGVTSGRTGN
mgnify:CR=1 FL=1